MTPKGCIVHYTAVLYLVGLLINKTFVYFLSSVHKKEYAVYQYKYLCKSNIS